MHCAAWKFDCLGEERVLWLRSFKSTIWFVEKLWSCRESWKNHERAVQSQSWRNPKSFWVRFIASLNYYSVIIISLLTSNNLSRSKIARIVQIVFSVQIFRKISLPLIGTNFSLRSIPLVIPMSGSPNFITWNISLVFDNIEEYFKNKWPSS